MITRFQKGKLYSLCLIRGDGESIYTWTVNVTHVCTTNDYIKFSSCEYEYYVSKDYKTCKITWEEMVERTFYGAPYRDMEIRTNIVGLTNIVKGWQF